MLQVNYVLAICLFIIFQFTHAQEVDDYDKELDEEFLEILGSFETEQDEWYDLFWSMVEEAEHEDSVNAENK